MKRIIKLTENQLDKLVKNLIKEEETAPFRNSTEGDKFRKWVNKYYPQVAAQIKLDPSGEFNNDYIRKAWNYSFGKNDTMGDRYNYVLSKGYEKSMSYNPTLNPTNVSKTSSVPFKNATEGNEFRKWVNKYYPQVAAQIQLDPSGEYNNSYITNAWNYKVGGGTIGEKFLSQKKNYLGDPETSTYDQYVNKYKGSNWYGVDPEASKMYSSKSTEVEKEDWYGTKGYQKRSIELAPSESIPQVLKGAAGDRMNREIHYINQRSQYRGVPFFIVDPRLKIVAAFDESHKFIRLSETVEGKDKQPTTPLTYREWCQSAGFKCKTTNNNLGCDCNGDLSKKYGVIELLHKRALSTGVYKAGGTKYEAGYTGAKNVDNVITIKNQSGLELASAIHALVPVQNRIVADTQLKKYLGDAQKTGKIPQQYNDLVNSMISNKSYDLSTGCFNVDPEFVNDSRILDIARQGAMIFVMSEDKDYYLVQMDKSQGAEFFNELKGENGFCKKPTSIATQVGGEPIDIRKRTV
jgi:hypothetical protein